MAALVQASVRSPYSSSDTAERALKALLGSEGPILEDRDGSLRDAATSDLIRLLEDRERTELGRARAAKLLGVLRAEQAVDHLLRAFADHTQPEVQRRCAEALGEIADRRAVPHLVQRLRIPTERNKGAIIVALGEIGDREAAGAVVQASVTEPGVRGVAEFALRSMNLPLSQAIELLVRHYYPDTEEVLRRIYETPDFDELALAACSPSTIEQSMGFEQHLVAEQAWNLMTMALGEQIFGPLRAGLSVDQALIKRAKRALEAATNSPSPRVRESAARLSDDLDGLQGGRNTK